MLLKIIKSLPEKIEGIKISLLDKNFEKYFRKLLPKNIRLFTGDDFNYPELIAGDENGYSDALLGILTAIAPVANTTLKALSKGNSRQLFDTMKPTLPLSRKIF